LTNCRKGKKESVSEIGCRVLPTVLPAQAADQRERVKDMITSVHQLQDSIINGRQKLEQLNSGNKDEKGDTGGDADGTEKHDFEETIAVLSRDVVKLEGEIELLEKGHQSLLLQQDHARTHRQQVHEQSATLNNQLDEKRQFLFDANKKDHKKLEDELAEIKKFIEANRSAKETLERQVVATNDEKKNITTKLDSKRAERDQLKKKLETLELVSNSLKNMAGASDELVKFLKQRSDDFRNRFENRVPEANCKDAMTEFEEDENFLRGLEYRVNEFCNETAKDERARSNLVKDMLHDLISLRRNWSEMLLDRWAEEDLNFSCFFEEPQEKRGSLR